MRDVNFTVDHLDYSWDVNEFVKYLWSGSSPTVPRAPCPVPVQGARLNYMYGGDPGRQP